MKRLVIAHLYPREMNIYGDLGNIIALTKRLEWRGYNVEVKAVEAGQPFDFAAVDLVFGGGGQDSGQLHIGEDLLERGEELRQAAVDGMPMLLICGLYQLFGRGFTTLDSREIDGIDVFHARTLGGTKRLTGNLVVESAYGRLVGFENHSGTTILEDSQAALGRVRQGFGNDASGRFEGAVSHNAIGTYLHGPVLPKNPRLTDHLLQVALERRYPGSVLIPLDDALEQLAAQTATTRPR